MYEYWLGGAKSLTDKYHAICETYRPPFFCSWKNVWSRVRACPSPHQPDASFVDVRLGLRIMAVQIWFGACLLVFCSTWGWVEVEWLDHLHQLWIILQLVSLFCNFERKQESDGDSHICIWTGHPKYYEPAPYSSTEVVSSGWRDDRPRGRSDD